MQFRIFNAARSEFNRLWIETLMDAASGPNGLSWFRSLRNTRSSDSGH